MGGACDTPSGGGTCTLCLRHAQVQEGCGTGLHTRSGRKEVATVSVGKDILTLSHLQHYPPPPGQK